MEFKLVVSGCFLLRLVDDVQPTLAIKQLVELTDQLFELARSLSSFKIFSVHLCEFSGNFGERLGVDIVKSYFLYLFLCIADEVRNVKFRLQIELKRL